MKSISLFPAIALTAVLGYAQDAAVNVSTNTPVTSDSTAQQNATDETVAVDSVAKADTAKSVEPTPVSVAEPPVQAVLLEGTPLEGSVHGFLKADKSPYLVNKDIVVERNMVLVIEQGVKILFAPGTGLHVKGQLAVSGTSDNNVQFASAMSIPKNGDWKGIFITGNGTSDIRNAVVSDAITGIAVENSAANIHTTKIEKSSSRGLYAKNATVEIIGSQFLNHSGAAVHIDSYSKATLNDVQFEGNNVALYNAPLAITNVTSTNFENNTYGILDMGNSSLTFENTKVSKNKIGASAVDVLEKGVVESITDNEANFDKNSNAIADVLPAVEEIPDVDHRPVNSRDKIGDLLAQKESEDEQAETKSNGWSIMGNVMIGNHYHHVIMEKNKSKDTVNVAGEIIEPGDRYKNIFQVPGFGTEASIYLLMQSSDGKTIEFNGEYTGDSWNRFSPTPVTLTYTDAHSQLMLGDFTKMGGDVYMAALPVFGVNASAYILRNNVNQPLFELNGFFGEVRKPYLIGDRHPDIYENYIEDGETQAQRLAYGASFKWAPLRRFDAKVGFIYANDEIEDPLLRDGSTHSNLTSEPMQESFSVYADGNWLFYPGDIELNGQIAVGRADTANVYKERAINQVFTEANVSTSSMSTLRELMANEKKINSLSSAQLEEIFGENTTLSRKQMRDKLRDLIREAKRVQKEYVSDRDEDRVMGLNWGSQNFALGASLHWNIYNTTISGHLKYVGEDFYSEGSADQLADTREFGGNIEQIITKFWTLNFGYLLNIENAANGDKTNLFGLGEGTRWGLFSDDDSKWAEAHELDYGRTKYIQNWTLGNTFNIGKNITVNAGYNLEYRTQYRPYQLHGDYILEDGIYKDSWFAIRKNKPTTEIADRKDTIEVDAEHWAHYMELSNEPYLASKFQERIYRNTWNLDVSLQAYKTTFKAGGRWTIRTDDSKFYKDDLIKDMDLSNTTWAKMGYYFGGADFFEQAYPVSASTALSRIQNHLEITPRFKSYKRNDMTETEITIDEDFEISFLRRFLIVGISGEFRHQTTEWEENDKSLSEDETDILGNLNLRLNHTKHLSTEWYGGSALYFRPDNLSDEYKDIYGGIRVNYVF